MEKTKVRVGDKVINLCEERKLLGRFLIIQGSRPELMSRLEETIGEYKMAVVPRSLYTVDGSLFIPTDKANLMRLIEEASPQAQLETPPATGNLHRILVIDVWPLFKVTITSIIIMITLLKTTIIIIKIIK